ncbi:MAG: substrate-binding domain-containing protein [Candidatus Eremiobacteraeota bacterium]|nr:substrate-binding domain-containing protein [Candidatus Eremiobacteraeota bacterium]
MNRTTATLLIAAFTIVLAGCTQSQKSGTSSGQSSGQTASTATKTIGVSIQDLQAQFYEAMQQGMKDEANKLGYKISFTDANRDQARQTSQVEDFISQRVDAIILTPVDSKAVGPAIVEANNANVPVFTADIASTSSKGVVVSHVASDNGQGGRVAADLLCKALGNQGTVAIIDQPEVTSVQERVKGFREQLATKCPAVKIVADQTAGGDRVQAATVMDNLLQTYPNLSGVFGINDDSALGALKSIKAAGKLDKIKIVGYDATPEARRSIDAGLMVGDPEQHPDQIGKLTIDQIHLYFSGKKLPKYVPVPVGSYTGKKS